ncbi:MAG: hypothetical protein R6W81_15215, partial [Bacteroidales bacterium]
MKPILLLSKPKWMRYVTSVILFLLFTGISAITQAQTVSTDKLDYAPGETVTITGSDWMPGETVQITLLHIEPDIPEHEHDGWDLIADENGEFIDYWYVSEQELGTTLHLIAYGTESKQTAETIFTDAGNFEFSATSNSANVSAGAAGTLALDVSAQKGNGTFTTTLSFSGTNLGTGTNQIEVPNLSFLYTTTKDDPFTHTFIIGITVGTDVSDGTYTFTATASSSTGRPNTKTWDFSVIVGSGSTGGAIKSVSVGSQTSPSEYGTASTPSYIVTSVRAANGTVNGTYSVDNLPAGVTGSFSLGFFTSIGSNAFPGTTLTLNVPASLGAGTYDFAVWLTDNGTGST